jgi:hypothetical protein
MNKDLWHKKYSNEIISHFKFCQECGNPNMLQIHHLTYTSKIGIYNEKAKDLIKKNSITVLCKDCHIDFHKSNCVDGLTKILPADFDCYECSFCGKTFYGLQNDVCNYCEEGQGFEYGISNRDKWLDPFGDGSYELDLPRPLFGFGTDEEEEIFDKMEHLRKKFIIELQNSSKHEQ